MGLRHSLRGACLLLAAASAWGAGFDLFERNFPNSVALSAAGRSSEEFTVGWAVRDQTIEFAVRLPKEISGWFALGLSASQGMAGSDVWLLKDKEGEDPTVADMFAKSTATPELDEQQDVRVIRYSRVEGARDFILSRPIGSIDEMDWPIRKGDNHLAFAYGEGAEFGYHHDRRGVKTLDLLDPQEEVERPLEDGEFKVKLTMDPTPLKARTNYICQSLTSQTSGAFKPGTTNLLPVDKKYHITREVPIIKSKHTHHIVLYACDKEVVLSKPQPCYDEENDIQHLTHCKRFITIWAVGGGIESTPEGSGIAIGDCEGCSKYFMLQTHYDNPEETEFTDNYSGLELTLTSKPRPLDLNIFAIGININGLSVPPKEVRTEILVDLPQCAEYFPAAGITVHKVLNHMHGRGRSLWTDLIRDGAKAGEIARQDYYSFDHQTLYKLKDPLLLKKGDRFRVHCVYDTSNDLKAVMGGEGTNEEMCYVFLYYTAPVPTPHLFYCGEDKKGNTARIEPESMKFEVIKPVALQKFRVPQPDINLVGLMSDSLTVKETPDAKMVVGWKLAADKKTIQFAVRTEGIKGWISIGLSDSLGGMKGGDFWVLSRGEACLRLQDYWGTHNGHPKLDDSQDARLLRVEERYDDVKEQRVVEFLMERDVKTCDEEDLIVQLASSQSLVWAYGRTNAFSYHGADRGFTNIFPDQAQKTMVPQPVKGEVLLTRTLAVPNIELPAQETTYMCSHFVLPQDDTYHIISADFEPISKGPFNAMHHVIVFACEDRPEPELLEKAVECKTLKNTCSRFIVGAVPGMQNRGFAPNTGIRMGNCVGCAKYAMMQMHYNNPNLVEGLVDSSGMKLTYTTNLRKHSVQTIGYGGNTDPAAISLPKNKVTEFEYVCPSDTHTVETVGKEGARIVGIINHMHLTGKEMVTTIVRNGKEIGRYNDQKYYSFDHQEPIMMGSLEDVRIMPGDEVRVNCTWDLSKVNHPVYGGPGTQEEMCLAFIIVYPPPKIDFCIDLTPAEDGTKAIWKNATGDRTLGKAYVPYTRPIPIVEEPCMAPVINPPPTRAPVAPTRAPVAPTQAPVGQHTVKETQGGSSECDGGASGLTVFLIAVVTFAIGAVVGAGVWDHRVKRAGMSTSVKGKAYPGEDDF